MKSGSSEPSPISTQFLLRLLPCQLSMQRLPRSPQHSRQNRKKNYIMETHPDTLTHDSDNSDNSDSQNLRPPNSLILLKLLHIIYNMRYFLPLFLGWRFRFLTLSFVRIVRNAVSLPATCRFPASNMPFLCCGSSESPISISITELL